MGRKGTSTARLLRLPRGARIWAAMSATILLLGSLGASARTIAVPADAPTIKGAMIQARAGDIILVACGVYRESDIQVKPGVSLWSGTLQPDCVTIDAQQRGRCLIFSGADSTTQVVGFTLRGGSAPGRSPGQDSAGRGGAVLCEDSAPRLIRCLMTGNSAGFGGALAATGKVGPRLENCVLRANQAERDGGAIWWSAAEGELVGTAVVNNGAMFNGGALAASGGSLRVRDSLFATNEAGSSGGAMSLHGTALLAVGSVFHANQGGLAGGAIAATDAAPLLRHCTMHANAADGEGSVLGLNRARPRLESCLVTGSPMPLLQATDSAVEISASNVWSAGAGRWPGLLGEWQDRSANRSVDPHYCRAEGGDLHLQAGSPCLADSGAAAAGALGSGCGERFPPDVVH